LFYFCKKNLKKTKFLQPLLTALLVAPTHKKNLKMYVGCCSYTHIH